LFIGIVAISQPTTILAQDDNSNQVLGIDITAPEDNAVVTEDTVTLSGKVTDPSATVTVDGFLEVTPSADGSFSTSIQLSLGKNTIEVTAEVEGKEPVSKTITVTYKIEEELEITAKYPKVEITSGEIAEFEVELKFIGEYGGVARVFDLVATAPKDWAVTITPSYPKDKKIASIQLLPGFGVGEKILVRTAPAYWLRPEPGEYPIILEATSGEVQGTFELTAVISAKYKLILVPTIERFNTPATAGKDNYFSIEVQNTGSTTIDDIKFSSSKPEDWTIKFEPNKVDTLPADDFQTIDVNIKPPPKTIAGDYVITLTASGNQTSADALDIRVMVETPTVWGWVGVIIVLAVIAGLVFIFRRFSRR